MDLLSDDIRSFWSAPRTWHSIYYPLLFAVALVGLYVAACDAASNEPSPSQTLEEAVERWRSYDLAAYRYRFVQHCFCAPPHLSASVSVRGDTIFAIEDVKASGTPIEETDHSFQPKTIKTVEQLFDLIRSAHRGNIDSVSVTYDDRMGFPTTLFVDPLQAMADEEVTYAISDVEPLDPEAN